MKVPREPQLVKASLRMISTDAGMQVDLSDEQLRNAHSPIVISLEFGSNVKSVRELHPLKQS
jgi:hypothetical protein